ncbi:MAG: hypothetical protein KU38_02945 [Sulfurovum sp. FS08-3]|jgi:DNA-binding transcriptional regulator YhcF (GntR family)|nr:MAG: hypothetical protein KU38_02945 [Sulfurovum sp. FS08-3]
MKNSEKLKLLLENEIIPDLESAIDELFSEIEKAKDVTKEQRGDLDELHQMKDEFKEILRELHNNELEEEEIHEILEALMEAKSDDIES